MFLFCVITSGNFRHFFFARVKLFDPPFLAAYTVWAFALVKTMVENIEKCVLLKSRLISTYISDVHQDRGDLFNALVEPSHNENLKRAE